MKTIIITLILISSLFSWEINTHRAIEKTAIEKSNNFTTFVKNSGIKNKTYSNERFEGYGSNMTYKNYLINGEENGISDNKWKQEFPRNMYAKELIEAGSILEDAQWKHFLDGGQYNYWDKAHGRFVNHFYDAQNGGHALTYGAFLRTDALHWGLGSKIYAGTFGGHATYVNSPNNYNYNDVLNYFLKGFTESSPTNRKKYQAKMLVGVGHLLHLMNDMTSPAHTRDDSHPLGDAMEVCGRGGESGAEHRGFRIEGNALRDYLGLIKQNYLGLTQQSGSITLPNIPKYSKFSDFISKESYWVSTHFFSNDTIFTKPRPSVSDTYESFVSTTGGIDKYYIKSYSRDGISTGTPLAIKIKSYITRGLKRYYTGSSEHLVLDKTSTFRGDYSVLKENAKILIPRAIANARNFLDYFFRGQIEAKIDGDNITIKNISNPSLVKDGHTDTLQYGGSFRFKYTTRYDNTLRDFEFMRDLDRAIPNIESIGEGPLTIRTGFVPLVSLAPGESIVVAIKRDTSITSKNIVVVYDGVIGNERGLAVCSAQTPNVMRN
jgi:hypothetical protein